MDVKAWILAAAMGLGGTAAGEAAPNVVATIKPVHSLVAAVMEGAGTPALLVQGAASPHTYSLKPSDARALGGADIVFWVGHGMEVFLEDSIATLAPKATIVPLAESPELELLPVREGGTFEPHADDVEEGQDHDHEHDNGEVDMHFWLDPQNAIIMTGRIAAELVAADPANATLYQANADKLVAALGALEDEIAATLAPVQSKPFIVFHDAYQYFERRFGLTVAGSITVSPEVMPGAQRVGELHAKLQSLGPACIFAEPQFEPAVVATIAEGTGAKTGVLDPEGAGLTEGPGLYAELLRGLAASLRDCLN